MWSEPMSTKRTIKSRHRDADLPGYHLYDDALDEFTAPSDSGLPVYLELTAVPVQLETLSSGSATVTVQLPRELARELGLLPCKAKVG